MNSLQILGYIGLAISFLIGGLLFIKIIMLMCQSPTSELTKRRNKKKFKKLSSTETKECNSIETASMYSEEYELAHQKRRQKSNIKGHSTSTGDVEMKQFQGSSTLSKKSLQTNSNFNSDSGFSNQASTGPSTVWCEIYPKLGRQDVDNQEGRSPLPLSRSTSTSSSPTRREQQHEEEQVLNESVARSLSPFSHQLTNGHHSNYTFSPESRASIDRQLDDTDKTINNFQVLKNQGALMETEVDTRIPLKNVIVHTKDSTIRPQQAHRENVDEIGQRRNEISSKIHVTADDANCALIIVAVATKTKIVGYCLNLLKQKCSFYSYSIDSLPLHISFKIFNNSSSPEDGYFSIRNLNFALLVWKKKISKYHRFRLYTDHPSITDTNCSSVKELKLYLNHTQICEGNAVLVNPDNFLIRPQQDDLLFGYRRYIQPAMYLQSDQIESFEYALNYWFGTPRERVSGTQFVPNLGLCESSVTEKFSSNFNTIQRSIQQWDYRTCQCSKSTELETKQILTYIS